MRVSWRGSWEWGWKEHSSVNQLNTTHMIAESKCMRIAVVLQFIIILSLYASYWTLFLLEWEGFRAVRTESFIDTIEFVGSRWFYNVYLYCKTRGIFYVISSMILETLRGDWGLSPRSTPRNTFLWYVKFVYARYLNTTKDGCWGRKVLEWRSRIDNRGVGRPATRWKNNLAMAANSRWMQVASNWGNWRPMWEPYVQLWTSYCCYNVDITSQPIILLFSIKTHKLRISTTPTKIHTHSDKE